LQKFDSAAKTVIAAAHNQAKALTDGLEVLGDTITFYTLDADAQWPFVTVPKFEERAAPIRMSSKLDIIGFSPLVMTMEREAWEAHVVEHQGWIQESYQAMTLTNTEEESNQEYGLSVQQQQQQQQRVVNNESIAYSALVPEHGNVYSISPQISVISPESGKYVSNPQRGPYLPISMLSPPPPPTETAIINTDLLSDQRFRLLFESFLLLPEQLPQTNKSKSDFAISQVMSNSIYFAAQNTEVNESSGENSIRGRGQDNNQQFPANSVLIHPIRDLYNRQGDIKAFALGVFKWHNFLSDLLPDDVHGVNVVLYNPCTSDEQASMHTFRIQGPKAAYMGDQDLHEVEHTQLCQETVLTEFDSYMHHLPPEESDTMTGTTRVTSTAATTCNYELRIFPSQEYKSSMETKGPAVFTAIIASVFWPQV
jgi:hypothetical protein